MKHCYFALTLFCFFIADLNATPGQVVLLRHAEEPTSGDTLSEQGFNRADAYVPYFTQSPAPFQMLEPVALYAQCSSKNHTSTRPVQTISALANIWEVPFYVRYTAGDYKDMVTEVMNTTSYNSKMVMICWEHDHLSDIAKAFGVNNPPSWDDSVFDRVWVINFSGDTVSSFSNLPEMLMYGDSTS
jgi:hypothetical protein